MQDLPFHQRSKPAKPRKKASGDEPRQALIYQRITQMLRKAIDDETIPSGAVLLEGPIAEIFRSTRTPVRKALQDLEENGLVSRFDGRGYIAGPPGVEPRRVVLDAAMLGVDADADPVRKKLAWEAIYDKVERDVVHLSVFDSYRINEFELARHFNVGRLVARDVLLRLERLGLIEKDERLRWVVTPLDAARVDRLYELRWLLEPAALRGAARIVKAPELRAMITGLRDAMASYPKTSPSELDRLEHDLHVGLLSRSPNVDLLHSLERTRCVLTLSKHVLGESAPMPAKDPFMSDHLEILEAIANGDLPNAEALLRTHLETSCVKVAQRVELVRNTFATPNLVYVTPR